MTYSVDKDNQGPPRVSGKSANSYEPDGEQFGNIYSVLKRTHFTHVTLHIQSDFCSTISNSKRLETT